VISQRKIQYPVSEALHYYLRKYGRDSPFPTVYDDLLRFSESIPYENPEGKETLWRTVMYPPHEMEELRGKLTEIYTQLKIGANAHGASLTEHLTVERIDFGDFGNSKPFRIRIVNTFNDNFDHYYVKKADTSRVFGLELEHILSPNRINYLVNGNTLIEEHIAGLPGDRFIRDYLPLPDINRVRIAKEFVKFNQRCFIRLLGDMRAVNYVVDVTPDFEEVQYRVRAIDFDQQSYEGDSRIYLAQYFDDNKAVVDLVGSELNPATIRQYQLEERTLVARRRRVARRRLDTLLDVMHTEEISPQEKITQLCEQLGEHHNNPRAFFFCRTMGDIVVAHLDVMLT